MSDTKRIWAYIPEELYNEIQSIAEKEFRKINPMITLLLQAAVREKNRKRNGRKKDNTQYSASNMGKSNPT